nr:immunoglobulin heavy chain junction region [Macaca mulatta]MOV87893.1 immunoglobulin heavy chain junction region [Macaca mulatta]MOV89614.1 immunoglobulin heavy chain junction region [Macaca mulatta]MOV89807.1 immunoglobulin heavy chain junction region [Macaca mulatta]MOV90630.1 immunoglobulin heavy chain junction region [Macaca mulatta]
CAKGYSSSAHWYFDLW